MIQGKRSKRYQIIAWCIVISMVARLFFCDSMIYAFAEESLFDIENKLEQDELRFHIKGDVETPCGTVLSNPAYGGSGSGQICYTSSDEAVAQVDANGTVVTYGAGEAIITATKTGDVLYQEISIRYHLQVVDVCDAQLAFQYMNSATILYGQEFCNPVVTGSAVTAEVMYESSDTAIATVVSGGAVTVNRAGSVTITASAIKEDQIIAAATYELNICRVEQPVALKFNEAQPEPQVYGTGFENGVNPLYAGSGDGEITYTSSDDEVAGVDSSGVVTIKKAGTTTISMIKEADDCYLAQSVSYVLTILRAKQSISFEENTPVVLKATQTYSFHANGVGTGEIHYYVDDTTCATINEMTGQLVPIRAGTVTVTACKDACDQYEEAFCSTEVVIEREKQSLLFAHGVAPTITYDALNRTYQNTALCAQTDNTITYEVVDHTAKYENFDPETGCFDILSAGMITIKASVAGDECYYTADACYTLTIEKREQNISFEQESYELRYGMDVVKPILASEDGEATDYGIGEIEYTILSGEEIAKIDAATGELFFQDGMVGTILVQAKKSEDECYEEAYATYRLTITKGYFEGQVYQLVGDKKNESGWYSDNVSIRAEQGYVISTSNSRYESNLWKDELTDVITEDTENGMVNFYIKNTKTNEISDVYLVQNVKLDKTNPELSVHVKEMGVWESIVHTITFGLWRKEKVQITIEGTDAMSNVALLEYMKVTGETSRIPQSKEQLDARPEESWTPYLSEISVEESEEFVIYAKVTDHAGNYTYASSDYLIMDDTKPNLVLTLEASTNKHQYGLKESKDGITVYVQVHDAIPSTGLKSIYYRVHNAEVVTQEGTLFHVESSLQNSEQSSDQSMEFQNKAEQLWLTEEDMVYEWQGEVVVDAMKNNADGIVIEVIAEDNLGNISTEYQTMNIYHTKPIIEVTYLDDPEPYMESYYSSNRRAQVIITDRTSAFDSTLASSGIQITAKDAKGDMIEISSEQVSDWITVEGLTPDEATHTATINFDTDANYEWKVAYENKVGNKADSYVSQKFTIDKNKPSGSITIDHYTWDDLITTLTFGLYKNHKVVVSSIAEDATSPIRSVEYLKLNDKAVKTQTELEQETFMPFTEDMLLDVDEVFIIYLKITDKAGNVSYISSDGFIVDMTKASVYVDLEEPNENGFYKDNVALTIHVAEKEPYSGIQKVEYWVVNGDAETQREVLYEFDHQHPQYTELLSTFTNSIEVEKEKNNSDYVKVFVKVTDNAGNVTIMDEHNTERTLSETGIIEPIEEEKYLRIDITAPQISVSYNELKANQTINGRAYYGGNRTATVTVTERTSSFLATDATEGIKVTAIKANGDTVTLPVDYISEWVTTEMETPDAAIHTATIQFHQDANYDFSMTYTDLAGNKAKGYENEKFTIDKKTPESCDIVMNTKHWKEFFETITFGLYSNTSIPVEITAYDETSPYHLQYYIYEGKDGLTKKELDKLSSSEWRTYEKFSISPQRRCMVYAKAYDEAGNYIYFNSDGYVFDSVKAEISLTPDQPNSHGVYQKDVTVVVDVLDNDAYSGIKSVDYRVMNGQKQTQGGNLFTYNKANPSYDELKNAWSGHILVDSRLNNSDDITVSVTVTDNANNIETKTVTLQIDVTTPYVEVSYDKNQPSKVEDGRAYYDVERTATVTIKERTSNFNANTASAGISITAVDVEGNTVSKPTVTSSDWVTVEGKTPDDALHIAHISFKEDANYTICVSYTDEADNTGNTYGPEKFTIDKTAPVTTITVEHMGTWDSLLGVLTFGLWSKDKVDVSATYYDKTSKIESVKYYKTADTTKKTAKELSSLPAYEWNDYQPFQVALNEKFVVYLSAKDYAGNISYISTDGVITDNAEPTEEAIVSELTVATSAEHGVYHNDVMIDVKVSDQIVKNVYSGLRNIRYEVRNMGELTQSGTLYTFDKMKPSYEDLLQTWTGKIKVKKELNNSNDVVITVFAEDNTGNESSTSIPIKIDTTNPSIQISYDNNTGDTSYGDRVYFDKDRVATITVIERNFDPKQVKLTITNTEDIIPVLSGWTTIKGSGNGDDTKHIATVRFTKDGDYTFDMEASDLAENKNEKVHYGESVAPTMFTIDKTLPEIFLHYDSQSAQNGMYFNGKRVATIEIKEHNFDESRVNLQMTATDDGKDSALPIVSDWSSHGDLHTATITYVEDGFYTFGLTFADMAGNEAEVMEKQSFYIDQTVPSLEITKIENYSANQGEVCPVITFFDTNINFDTVEFTLVGANRGEVEVTGSYEDIHNGKIFIFDKFEEIKEVDDYYTLTIKLQDMAGNMTEKTIEFSVNRFGSTYQLDDITSHMNGTFVSEEADVVITEINVDRLNTIQMTLFKNNQTITLKQDADYSVMESGGSGSWYKYIYTVYKDNFAEDGVYRLSLYSIDAANNTSDNTQETKETEITFGIDKTSPIAIVTDLEDGQTYDMEEKQVTVAVTDNLKLASCTAYVNNKLCKEWNTEEIDALIAQEKDFEFVIPESNEAQNMKLVSYDAAGNESVLEVKKFYVTTNLLIQYYNNKLLFFGSCGFAGLSAIGVASAVFLRRRKTNKEQ